MSGLPGGRRRFRGALAAIGVIARLALLGLLAVSLGSPARDDERLAAEAGSAPRGGVLVTRVVAAAVPGRTAPADLAARTARTELAPGDLVVGWRRAGGNPALPPAAGEIANVFDWQWVAAEQAPRGALRLTVERRGKRFEVAAGRGAWDVQVLPWLPPAWVGRARACLDDEEQRVKDTSASVASAASTARAASAPTAGVAAAVGWEALAAGRWVSRSPATGSWLWMKAGRDRNAAGQTARAGADFDQALRLAPGARGRVAVLRAAAGALADRSDLTPAAALADQAVRAATAAWGESLELAQAELDRGAVALAQGQPARAEEAWRRSLELRERLAPGSAEVAAVLGRLAGPALSRGDLDRAEALAGRALDILKPLAAPDLEAVPLMALGGVARERGDAAKAKALLQLALARHAESAPDSTTAEILNRLGGVARRHGDLGEAQRRFEQALALLDRLAPAGMERTNVLLNLGWVASDRGDLGTARRSMEQAVAARERLQPDSMSLASSLGQLALVVEDQGDLRLAESLMQRDASILARIAPVSMPAALAMGNLGEVALRGGAAARAAELCARAVAIQDRLAPGNPVVAGNLQTLAEAELARRHFAAAWSAGSRAAKLLEGYGGAARARASTLAVLGEVARQRGEPGRAAILFQQALVLQELQGYSGYEVADTLHVLGVLNRRRQPAAAARYFDRAIAMLEEQVRHLGGSHDLQAAYRGRHQSFYRDAIELAVERRRPREAFGLLERSRGQALLAQLAERDVAFARDVAPSLRQEERGLAAAIDQAEVRALQLERQGDAAQLQQARGQLADLHRRRDDAVARIRQASPRYAALALPVPLDLAAVRQALDAGTVMLSYSLGETASTLFVVSAASPLEVHRLPAGEEELRRRIGEMRGLIGEAPGSSVLGRGRRATLLRASRELYDVLLRPAARRIAAGRRLLVVPDGILHQLPWAALVRDEPGAPRQRWEYVAEWRPIHVAVSATVYDDLRRQRPPPLAPGAAAAPPSAMSLVAFADPQVPTWLRAARPRRADDLVLRSAVARGCSFAPLPYSRQEVAGIAGLFPAGSRVYLGAAATEERAKTVSRQARYLHFATHTTLDEDSPLDSAVVLAIPESFTRGGENGLLQAWEIFDAMRLDADLVVLSGCESALGREVGGEGLLGLTRAFQYAGARAVVASLWNVSDRMTAPLMVSFYRALLAGMPKDEALRQAQMEMLHGAGAAAPADAMDAEPFFWAGFELFGDWR